MSDTISLTGLDKADVLAALYNASKPLGMGFMQYDPNPMTHEEAEQLLVQTTRFDYLKGRVMQIDLSKDELNTSGYDRDNGQGAAARAIDELRASGETNSSETQQTHKENTLASARNTKGQLTEPTRTEREGNMVTMHLGLDDVAEPLNEAIDKVVKEHQNK